MVLFKDIYYNTIGRIILSRNITKYEEDEFYESTYSHLAILSKNFIEYYREINVEDINEVYYNLDTIYYDFLKPKNIHCKGRIYYRDVDFNIENDNTGYFEIDSKNNILEHYYGEIKYSLSTY